MARSRMKPPRPILALVAAIIAHVAFLQAPDPAAMGIKAAWYATAVIGTGMVAWLLLLRLQKREDQRPHLSAEIAARICETLILVGAGYSTVVPPGVIKLGGVLPLGWACAVMALLIEHMSLLGGVRGHPLSEAHATVRVVVLVVMASAQAVVNLAMPGLKDDAMLLRNGMMLILLGCVLNYSGMVRRAIRGTRP